MTECTRFEQEGLAAIEHGESLDEHFHTCEICIEEHRKYVKLAKLLASVSDDISPAVDWQEKVLEGIKSKDITRDNKSTRWYGSVAAGFATILIASVWLMQIVDQSAVNQSAVRGELAIVVNSGSTIYRGYDAKINDELSIRGQIDATGYSEIRIYRDGQLYYSCNAEDDCNSDPYTIGAVVTLRSIGEYQTILIQSDKKILLVDKQLDPDVLAARDQGALVTPGEIVLVR